jgi:hypothetical protein
MTDRTSAFDRYIGVDYSGAETPTSSLKGLRIFTADRAHTPVEVPPPPGPRKYWTRRGVAEWLVNRLSEDCTTLVGIDHGLSFPLAYFSRHGLALDWDRFLDDFHRHWPTDDDHVYVQFVLDGMYGDAAGRSGDSRWRRIAEVRARAKSVFHFNVQGSVAKSTHAGLPWLLHIRRRLGKRVHFWPFDGWAIPEGRSAIAEAYPALYNRAYLRDAFDPHQNDAFAIAAWMRDADMEGTLADFFAPSLAPAERKTAEIEGWILGVN